MTAHGASQEWTVAPSDQDPPIPPMKVKGRDQVFDWDVCSGYSKTCKNGSNKCSKS